MDEFIIRKIPVYGYNLNSHIFAIIGFVLMIIAIIIYSCNIINNKKVFIILSITACILCLFSSFRIPYFYGPTGAYEYELIPKDEIIEEDCITYVY